MSISRSSTPECSDDEDEWYAESPSPTPECSDDEDEWDADYILRWIYNIQPKNAPPIEYPDLDCAEIVDRASEAVLVEVIETLIDDIISSENDDHLETVKELIELTDNIVATPCLNKILEYVIENDDEQSAIFFLGQGASVALGVKLAIENDSSNILEELDIEADEDYVLLALRRNSYKDMVTHAIAHSSYNVIQYFLLDNFDISAKIILSFAVEHNNENLFKIVFENIDSENVYDIVKSLVSLDQKDKISNLFEYLNVEEILRAVYEQDNNKGFFDVTLEYAKKHFPNTDMSHHQVRQLLAEFDEKLKVSFSFLAFPEERFTGDEDLKSIREDIDKDKKLYDENRVAANLIGTAMSPFSQYLSRSPYHIFESKRSETYFRSRKDHPITLRVKGENTVYASISPLDEKAEMGYGGAAHHGLIKHPQDSLIDFKSSVFLPSHNRRKQFSNEGNSEFYDSLLSYKNKMCKFIQSNLVKENLEAIKVGHYNEYPCLMILVKPLSLAMKVTPATKNAWAEIVASYFLGLVNYLAREKGLDIELVRRSSFGFLEPTIALCNASIRLNIGLVPQVYALILIDALKILNQVLTILNNSYYVGKLNADLPNPCFFTSPEYKKYLGKKNAPRIHGILELATAKTEKNGKSTATNLVRTAIARDNIAAVTFNLLCQIPNKDKNSYAQIFLDALKSNIGKIVLDKTLKFKSDNNIVFSSKSLNNIKIEDNDFFYFIKKYCDLLKNLKCYQKFPTIEKTEEKVITALEQCYTTNSIENLFYYLKMVNELLYSRSILSNLGNQENPYGSGSDEEDENTEQKKFYAKKIILRNGMRAIIAALHAGSAYLFPNYLTDKPKKKLCVRNVYYETQDFLASVAKFIVSDVIDKNTQILLLDANPCVNDGCPSAWFKKNELGSIKILIVDCTSSSIELYRNCYKLYKDTPTIEILLLVSSGLKNEQNGSDKNPYGTVRIFTKDKLAQAKIVKLITDSELPITSNVAHHHRQLMKRLNFVPCNATIIQKNKITDSKAPPAAATDTIKSTISPRLAFESKIPSAAGAGAGASDPVTKKLSFDSSPKPTTAPTAIASAATINSALIIKTDPPPSPAETKQARTRKDLANLAMVNEKFSAILSRGNYKISPAFSEGDCIYDAIALGINEYYPNLPKKNIQSLRQLCKMYIDNLEETDALKSTLRSEYKEEYKKHLDTMGYSLSELEELFNKRDEIIARLTSINAELKKAPTEILLKQKEKVQIELRELNCPPDNIARWGTPEIEAHIICKILKIKLHFILLFDDRNTTYHQIVDENGATTVDEKNINYNDPKLIHIISYKRHFAPLLPNIRSVIAAARAHDAKANSEPMQLLAHRTNNLVILTSNTNINGEGYKEVDVPHDGSCCFYSITLSTLLPVINDKLKFNAIYVKLFGADSLLEEGQMQTLHEQLIYHNGTSDYISRSLLKKLIDGDEKAAAATGGRLRKVLGNYIKTNKNADFVNINHDQKALGDLDDYLNRNLYKREGFAGTLEIAALANMLNICIRTFQSTQQSLNYVSCHGENQANTIYLMYLHAEDNAQSQAQRHYRYLLHPSVIAQLKPHVKPAAANVNATISPAGLTVKLGYFAATVSPKPSGALANVVGSPETSIDKVIR